MKTRFTTTALAILISTVFGFAGEPTKKHSTMEQKVEFAKKNLSKAITSNNEGLVESGIKMIAKMKLRVPEANTEELQEQLDELSVEHPSATVRYKAYIASSICADPEWFAQSISVVNADEDEFFIKAGTRLQQKLFGAIAY